MKSVTHFLPNVCGTLDWKRKSSPQAILSAYEEGQLSFGLPNDTQSVKLMTTNSVTSIFVGLKKLSLTFCNNEVSSNSASAYTFLPVSFLIFFALRIRITSPRVSRRRNQKTGKRAPSTMSWIQYIQCQLSGSVLVWIAPPMNGPRAIPTTLVMPKMLIGILRSDRQYLHSGDTCESAHLLVLSKYRR
jgi:hypothetical protein